MRELLAVWNRRFSGVLAVLLLVCGCAWAQREALEAAAAPTSVDAVLQGMAARAGVIFVGTVVDVRRTASSGEEGGSGVVEVEFAVDQGLRGALTGSRYVLREWGGLWENDEQRYRPGERRLMLLHAPGPGGLSSPVGGMDGAIPIRPGANAAAEPLVDLRWVAARVSHGRVQYRAETPPIPRARPMAEVLHLPGEVTPVSGVEPGISRGGTETASGASEAVAEQHSVAAECASVSSVVTKLVRWDAGPQ